MQRAIQAAVEAAGADTQFGFDSATSGTESRIRQPQEVTMGAENLNEEKTLTERSVTFDLEGHRGAS